MKIVLLWWRKFFGVSRTTHASTKIKMTNLKMYNFHG